MAYPAMMFCNLYAMEQGEEIVDSQMELRGYMSRRELVFPLPYTHAIHSRMWNIATFLFHSIKVFMFF